METQITIVKPIFVNSYSKTKRQTFHHSKKNFHLEYSKKLLRIFHFTKRRIGIELRWFCLLTTKFFFKTLQKKKFKMDKRKQKILSFSFPILFHYFVWVKIFFCSVVVWTYHNLHCYGCTTWMHYLYRP